MTGMPPTSLAREEVAEPRAILHVLSTYSDSGCLYENRQKRNYSWHASIWNEPCGGYIRD